MRIQIITIKPTDIRATLHDSLTWLQAERVLLVVPDGAKAIARYLDLVMLHRQVQQMGAQLALVTAQPALRAWAESLPISVFATTQEAYLQPWESSKSNEREWRPSPYPRTRYPSPPITPHWSSRLPRWLLGIIASGLTASVLLACLLLLYLCIPSATILIEPPGKVLTTTLILDPDVALGSSADSLDWATEYPATRIPVQRLSVTVQGSRSQKTTGTASVASEHAQGQVTLSNRTNLSIRIPAGTGVRTSALAEPILFVLQQTATLAPNVGARVTVPVRAVEPGPTGNVAAGAINQVDGAWESQVGAINLAATTGGELVEKDAVSERDQEDLLHDLEVALKEQGLTEIQNRIGSQAQLLPATLIGTTQTKTYSHFVGEIADEVQLDVQMEVSALWVSTAHLNLLTSRQLDSLAQQQQVALLPESTRWKIRRATAAAIEIELIGKSGVIAHPADIRARLAGKSLTAASDLLWQTFGLQTAPQIQLHPTWFGQLPIPLQRLPIWAWRIQVAIHYADSGD